MAWRPGGHGIQRLQAWFAGKGFSRHRHDRYAIGVTDSGVQSFWYRGTTHASTAGDVVVLHPDELHDGYAGTGAGFGYRILYIDPAAVAAAVGGLPFVRNPIVKSERFRRLVEEAFEADLEPLAEDAVVLGLGEALSGGTRPLRVDLQAVARAREVLDAAKSPVHAAELEAASGLSRFDLARQFKARYGTSPYRYSVQRRLGWAREKIGTRPLAELALDAGFSDQAHFTRAFRRTYGVTPGRYKELRNPQ